MKERGNKYHINPDIKLVFVLLLFKLSIESPDKLIHNLKVIKENKQEIETQYTISKNKEKKVNMDK